MSPILALITFTKLGMSSQLMLNKTKYQHARVAWDNSVTSRPTSDKTNFIRPLQFPIRPLSPNHKHAVDIHSSDRLHITFNTHFRQGQCGNKVAQSSRNSHFLAGARVSVHGKTVRASDPLGRYHKYHLRARPCRITSRPFRISRAKTQPGELKSTDGRRRSLGGGSETPVLLRVERMTGGWDATSNSIGSFRSSFEQSDDDSEGTTSLTWEERIANGLGIWDNPEKKRSSLKALNPSSEHEANLDAMSPEYWHILGDDVSWIVPHENQADEVSPEQYWTWSVDRQQWFHLDEEKKAVVWAPKDFG
ncbi:uncharacterized protein BCR38DRAFT_439708 [Pseudomassariella vexata]|uniref:Uncharacterized protein n=1 Tax=Pseudomassariella vexata TaxID=1141098 RepID=A0A1Y2DPN4_9PEZI|nr:uncharacterized protein BCR38DRAFT_439708 [Pseudomassariella vexata]ORY61251.1 hypothetical protein BCR38DRAFT_439708 [Pseudomassariella vexata]